MPPKTHEGVSVSEDRWLADVLDRVGPGGQFLGQASTRRTCAAASGCCRSSARATRYEAWTAAGSPDVLAEAHARVEGILAGHEPPALGEDVEGALEELRSRAVRAPA